MQACLISRYFVNIVSAEWIEDLMRRVYFCAELLHDGVRAGVRGELKRSE